jgi:hypothetical protein
VTVALLYQQVLTDSSADARDPLTNALGGAIVLVSQAGTGARLWAIERTGHRNLRFLTFLVFVLW